MASLKISTRFPAAAPDTLALTGAYSLQAVRRSVDYAFNAFHSVHPATAASRRPRYEKR